MLYDVIVTGGGHAGIEAALAAARLGATTLLISQNLKTVGALSCNPAFGGPAKGGLVREVDALGGYCGLGADRAARQCRILGESKGPAVKATRNLVDRNLYCRLAQEFLQGQKNLTLLEDEACEVLMEGSAVSGLKLKSGKIIQGKALVLCGGTFWRGTIFHGHKAQSGGRNGEMASLYLSDSLARLGHKVGRLSTNTAPRLLASSVDFSVMHEQPGDPCARPFSVLTENGPQNLTSCWLTYTNFKTHEIVAAGANTSALIAGLAPGAGPRYCPSIEDKIKRFPQRTRHQIFVEPDEEELIYPSGLTTGLAPEVQEAMIKSIAGLENAKIVRPGYAIEYDYIEPTGLYASLASKFAAGLFLAGQVNGTSGYEEAAAQGLLAGLNAALYAAGKEPVCLSRSVSLTGVMADDLSRLGVTEPYRMFSSRAEWRLLLREDNADLRLSPLALELGLLDEERKKLLWRKEAQLKEGLDLLTGTKINPTQARNLPESLHLKETTTLAELLKRPTANLELFKSYVPKLFDLEQNALLTLEVEVKFAGYIERQKQEVARQERQENQPIAKGVDFKKIPGLSTEAAQLLEKYQPQTLGQAGRISGMTPAALTVLAVHLKALKA